MFYSLLGSLGWNAPPTPPPATITAVRIPANGASAHLISMTTTNDCGMCCGFLHRVPDAHRYWRAGHAWKYRDLSRLDLQVDQKVARARHLQQKEHCEQEAEIHGQANDTEGIHVRQRQRMLFADQCHHLIPKEHAACVGAYYVFYSFATEDLPQNPHVPAWLSRRKGEEGHRYWGDVFVVKLSPHEYGPRGWAAYEDIDPTFLNVLSDGPLKSWNEDVGFRYWWEPSDDRPQGS